MTLATLEDSQALYDSVVAARGDIGAGSGNFTFPTTYPPMTQPVGPHDMTTLSGHQALWDGIMARRAAVEQDRLAPPGIRLWDGGMALRGVCAGWLSIDYEWIENDTGSATLKLPLNHYLAKWVMNFRGRAKRNVIVTIDKQGSRWSGFMDKYTVIRKNSESDNSQYLEVTFKHDFEQAKHVLCWANPFLIPGLQFPKLWVIFGPAKWCLLMTLFVNLLRLETSIWTLPDNPLDIMEWAPLSFDPGEWRNIVKPFSLLTDSSNTTIIFSRFRTWFDTAKKDLEDAQLTVVCRRYLKGEDPHPFWNVAGPLGLGGSIQEISDALLTMIPIRHGCLVWDIVDNSGWGTGTAFGGSLLTGFVRALISIASDGTTEGVDIFTGNPTIPGEYYNPLFIGTAPSMPWVVFDCGGQYNGTKSMKFEYFEATDTSFVAGGHSMPGVNEAISAGVNMTGDFLTSLINSMIGSATASGPFDCIPAIDLPPLGGIMDSLAKILYEDTFLAFNQWPTLRAAGTQGLPIAGLENLITGLGDFHYYEGWCEGADKANTLSALLAIRAKIWATRARTCHEIEVSDAAPYVAGEPGYGHFWLGNRIGTTFPEFPIPYTIFVERVKKLGYGWDEKGPKGWKITVGYPEPQDPALKALDWIRNINSALSTMGIL